MAVARMAGHRPAVPAGCSAAAAGRLLTVQVSREPARSWVVRPPRSVMPMARMARIAVAATYMGIRSSAAVPRGRVLAATAGLAAAGVSHRVSDAMVTVTASSQASHAPRR